MDLLQGLKAGSETDFKSIMDEYYSRLFNFANGYLNNDESVKELLQDVFLLLWDKREKLADNTTLSSYLFTITRNKCIDQIRKEKLMLQFRTDKKDEYIRLSESYNALSDQILDEIFASEVQEVIENAINNLPDQCQKVFRLSRNNGLKNKEISKNLEISEKTVEAHITKALKLLKQVLEKKFPGSFYLFTLLFDIQSKKNAN